MIVASDSDAASSASNFSENVRMTKDTSKGIASITWNVLHQPQTVTFTDGSTISYTYAADGTKLRETRVASGLTTTTDYTGNLILENGTRSRLLFDGGYVSLPGNAYHWFLTDHLGSVRVVASASGAAEEYDHYYPLGGPIAQYSSVTSQQPLKFQGKEWGASKGLDLYDFGARRYDPASGRWLSQDPLAEKYYAHSPYLFCAANPLLFIDPDGMRTYVIQNEDGTYTVVGGILDDDLNVYVGHYENEGFIQDYSIGTTAYTTSFYDTDHNVWVSSIIDLQDSSGENYLKEIMTNVPGFLEFFFNAENNEVYDFKKSNGEKGRSDYHPYRGMLIGSSIMSARDVGNIAAGYVAGIYGIPYIGMRLMFDMYQSYTDYINGLDKQLKTNSYDRPVFRFHIEGPSSREPQYEGWRTGAYIRMNMIYKGKQMK